MTREWLATARTRNIETMKKRLIEAILIDRLEIQRSIHHTNRQTNRQTDKRQSDFDHCKNRLYLA